MVEVLVGALSILVAFLPKPSYYFGEGIFGIKIMPYWVFEYIQITLGTYLVVDGLWPHVPT